MTQTRMAALTAIVAALNTSRLAALDAARADYIAAHGAWNQNQEVDGQFYPPEGPTIPITNLDDPSDIRFTDGKIYRRLTLFSDNIRPLNYVGGNSGGEPEHNVQLEWSVLCPASETANRLTVFNRGLADIGAALEPLRETGLTDAATGESVAISFEITSVDFQTHDIGDHAIQAAFIALSFTLFATSILS